MSQWDGRVSRKEAIERWVWDWIGWIAGGIFLLCIGACVLGIIATIMDHSEEDFMAECSQHEPHYQCVAKWRAGEAHNTVTPVPVVVPVVR